jgi:S-adenosylmethionine:tRNA ribosyltransferase-isomerase
VIAASAPVQRPPDARLLVVGTDGAIAHRPRAAFAALLRKGDLVVANDAATIPASLSGIHVPTGGVVELRLAARRTLAADAVTEFTAVVFGAGDFRTPTEHRPLPPPLAPGDALQLGSLHATVTRLLGHPRLIDVRFDHSAAEVWEGLARHGRPIQYAYVPELLANWDTWTAIAHQPVAFEPPSAGFVLDWALLADLRARGIGFAAVTHAAGISSTGDADLDALLPLDEAYDIPPQTARLIRETRTRGRIIAIGTTVVRALEHAARRDGTVRPGPGVATGRIGPGTPLRVVDAILSGTHEPGTSHYDLLRAFQDDEVLRRVDEEEDARGYRTHEFGDSVFLVRRVWDDHDQTRPTYGDLP